MFSVSQSGFIPFFSASPEEFNEELCLCYYMLYEYKLDRGRIPIIVHTITLDSAHAVFSVYSVIL